MFERVLVPLDGSMLAQCVFSHALAVVQAFDSEATLLHVLEQPTDERSHLDPVAWHLRKAESRAYLNNVGNMWRDAGVQAEKVLLEGQASERIIEYAESAQMDLVVLSSHGKSGLSESNMSGVVQKIIYRAYRSVLLVRAYQEKPQGNLEVAPAGYGSILVPLDGSKRAESILPFATRLAQKHRAELLLVHVVPRPELLTTQPLTEEDEALLDRFVDRNKEEAVRYLESLQSRLNVPAHTYMLVGDNVADRLQDFVAETGVDLVMLSAHGHSGARRVYGSVVTSLITYGATPLLIMQDLPQQEIQPTEAEVAARKTGDSAHHRSITHAQPAISPTN